MRSINCEQGLVFKIILNATKGVFMLRSRICRLHFETTKVLGTDFVRCEKDDVTIPHALCTSGIPRAFQRKTPRK